MVIDLIFIDQGFHGMSQRFLQDSLQHRIVQTGIFQRSTNPTNGTSFGGGSFPKIPERWTTPDVFVKSFVFGASLGFFKLPLSTFDTVGEKRMYKSRSKDTDMRGELINCMRRFVMATMYDTFTVTILLSF